MTVPGTVLRALLGGGSGALLLALAATAAADGWAWPSLAAGAALVAWVVAAPGSPAPTVLLLLGVLVALDAGAPAWPVLVLQAGCLSGVHLLASLCALAPRQAEWEVSALRPVARRWALVQVACLPVVAAAAAPRDAGAGGDVAAGVLVLAVTGGLVAVTLRRRPSSPGGNRERLSAFRR